MRRFMLSLCVVSLLLSMVGCRCSSGCGDGGCGDGGCGHGGNLRGHGICDCLYDDHCSTRAPWVRMGTPATPVYESVPAPVAVPVTLPEVKNKL